SLLPALAMVSYEMPDDVPLERHELRRLPEDWRRQEALTQEIGNLWLDSVSAALLFVPSVIVPIGDGPDWNVLINLRHAAAKNIAIAWVERFELDVRLFR